MMKNDINKRLDELEKKHKQDIRITYVILVIVLLLSTISLCVNLGKEPLKGDKGDVGDQGIQGIQGVKGEQGIQGLQGDKGDKGDTGDRGPPGVSGFGRNGKDCIPNKKPVITLIDINGSRISKCTMFTFWLNVSVNDPDNDDLQIDFYFSEESNSSWIHHKTFFGTDGYYNDSIVFEYPYLVDHKTIFFQVVVWDGSDIGLSYYNYVI